MRRVFAIAGSAITGAFATIALATPAHAHHPEVVGKADCQADGTYKVTWTVKNVAPADRKATIEVLTPTPNTPVTGLAVNTEIAANATKTGTQIVPGSTKLATLYVKLKWVVHVDTNEATGRVTMPGTCQAPAKPPTAAGQSTCDKFTITITNPQGGQPTEAKVTYGTQVKTVTVAAGKTETVELAPSSETEATVEFSGWKDTVTVKYEKPANCGGLPVTGDKVTTYVGAGTGVAALGVVVFFLARRRLAKLRRLANS